jgi:hypothetical protein
MKKLLTIFISLFIITNSYPLALGGGIALENLAGEKGTDPYLALKADFTVPFISIIDYRFGFLLLSLQKNYKSLSLGSGLYSDFLINVDIPLLVKLYFPLGLSLTKILEENGSTIIAFKGGIGGEKDFLLLKGYLEAGININKNEETKKSFYLQIGFKKDL